MTTGIEEGSSVAHLPSFNFDEGSEVQMVPVLDKLVRAIRYMTRSATKGLFSTLGLDGKGLE